MVCQVNGIAPIMKSAHAAAPSHAAARTSSPGEACASEAIASIPSSPMPSQPERDMEIKLVVGTSLVQSFLNKMQMPQNYIHQCERNATLADGGDEQVHRHRFVVGAPDELLEIRKRSDLIGRREHLDGDTVGQRSTSVFTVTVLTNSRSSVTPIPGPSGTGMMPLTVSSSCSTMSRL